MEKNRRNIRWLYSELPRLVSSGTLSEEAAQNLREYYSGKAQSDSRQTLLTLFAITGSVLIGGGIILLVAHNWADLPWMVRKVLSFIPLGFAQILSGYVILKRLKRPAWRESSAIFHLLMVGASIALVGQTYHIPGDTGNYLLAWLLLSAPVIYLLGSSLSAVLYLLGVTAWSGYAYYSGGNSWLFFPFAGLMIPHIVDAFKKGRYTLSFLSLSWVGVACAGVAVGFVLGKSISETWIFAYSSLFGILFFSGTLLSEDVPSGIYRPFYLSGLVGITVLSILLTFQWSVSSCTSAHSYWSGIVLRKDVAVITCLEAGYIALFAACVVKKKYAAIDFGFLPLLYLLSQVYCMLVPQRAATNTSILSLQILFNIYALYLGVSTLVEGARNRRMGMTNLGLVIITVLIISRFFDMNISFTLRAIVFTVIGAGFLLSNYAIVRKMKKEKLENRFSERAEHE